MTVASIAARALRRTGLIVVPEEEQPSLATTVSATAIASRALQSLGIIVTAAERPAGAGTVSVTDLAERTLEGLGVIVQASERPSLSSTVTTTAIATQALQHLGVAVAAADRPATATTSTVTDIAERALQSLGVIVPTSARPAVGTATAAAIAARALQNLGIVTPESERPTNTTTVTVTVLANRALQGLGLPVPAAEQPGSLGAIVSAADLATRTLQILAVIASDETAGTYDNVAALLAVYAVYDELYGRGLVDFAVTAVPRSVSEEVAMLAALQLATAFGKQGDPAQRTVLEERVRVYQMQKRAQASAEARVQAIHSGLVAAGLATYANSAIPLSLSDDYVALAMIEVAPMVGQPADVARIPALEDHIRRVALATRAQTDAVALVTSVHDRLVAAGLVDYAVGAIPVSLAESYAELLANDYRPLFGQPQNRGGEPAIEARIKMMATLARAQAVAEGKVAAIHDGLIRAGLAAYASSSIPRALSEEYVALVAIDLAPMFGGKADLAAVPGLEARVRRQAVLLQAQALAEARVLPVHDALVGAGLASWASSAVPRAVQDEYGLLVAVEMAAFLEKEFDRSLVQAAEHRVGRVAGLLRAQAGAEDRINAVHQSLIAQGLADWSSSAIPASVSDAYVALARFDLGPVYDKQVDAGSVPVAEAQIKRVALVSRAQELAEARVSAVNDAQIAQGNASWVSSAIPQSVAEDYVAIVAVYLAPTVGVKVDPAVVPVHEARIRQMAMAARAQTLAEQAVVAVHADLAARGKVRWGIDTIPLEAERVYILMAATQLCFEFGRPANPNDMTMATVDLARIISLPSSGETVRACYF